MKEETRKFRTNFNLKNMPPSRKLLFTIKMTNNNNQHVSKPYYNTTIETQPFTTPLA
jgi:hypothetical protein